MVIALFAPTMCALCVMALWLNKYYFAAVACWVALVFLPSCNSDSQQSNWSGQSVKVILDSVGRQNIAACFVEGDALLILKNDRGQTQRICFRKNFPVFADSLVQIKYDEYRSPRLSTTYLIKDTAVFSLVTVKIIHPSSNWQGQTPWQQPYVYSFPRLDNKR